MLTKKKPEVLLSNTSYSGGSYTKSGNLELLRSQAFKPGEIAPELMILTINPDGDSTIAIQPPILETSTTQKPVEYFNSFGSLKRWSAARNKWEESKKQAQQ